MSSAISVNLDQFNNLSSGNGLNELKKKKCKNEEVLVPAYSSFLKMFSKPYCSGSKNSRVVW